MMLIGLITQRETTEILFIMKIRVVGERAAWLGKMSRMTGLLDEVKKGDEEK